MNLTDYFPGITTEKAQRASLLLLEAAIKRNLYLHRTLSPYHIVATEALLAPPEDYPLIFDSIKDYRVMPGLVELIEAALLPSSNEDLIETLNGFSRYFQFFMPVAAQVEFLQSNSI